MGEIIGSRDELARLCEEARAAGQRVVLTNGTFDLLHVGHLRSLCGARHEGDLLVVGLNSDESVRGYKGPGRPVVPQEERAEILAALECVDFVHIFPEADACALLRATRPHVYAKGRDYDLERLPERAVADELGAEIVFTGDPKEHAVSDVLERIRAMK